MNMPTCPQCTLPIRPGGSCDMCNLYGDEPRNQISYPTQHAFLAVPTQLPQRQDALDDQLISLIEMANRAGCYDAADWLKKQMEKPQTHQDKDHCAECTGWHPTEDGERRCMACNPTGQIPAAGPPPWHTGPWTTR